MTPAIAAIGDIRRAIDGSLVTVDLRIAARDEIVLLRITSDRQRNQGHGGRALRAIAAAADAHGVLVRLTAAPIRYDIAGSGIDDVEAARLRTVEGIRKDRRSLRSWYRRHGWTCVGGDMFERIPVKAGEETKRAA
jgi:hypothetical protein